MQEGQNKYLSSCVYNSLVQNTGDLPPLSWCRFAIFKLNWIEWREMAELRDCTENEDCSRDKKSKTPLRKGHLSLTTPARRATESSRFAALGIPPGHVPILASGWALEVFVSRISGKVPAPVGWDPPPIRAKTDLSTTEVKKDFGQYHSCQGMRVVRSKPTRSHKWY